MLLARPKWAPRGPSWCSQPRMLLVQGCSQRSSCGRRHRGGDKSGPGPIPRLAATKREPGAGSASHAPLQPYRTGISLIKPWTEPKPAPNRAVRGREGCRDQHRGERPCRAVPGPWPACSRARSSSSRSSGEGPSKPWPHRDRRASSWPASPPANRCPGKGVGNPRLGGSSLLQMSYLGAGVTGDPPALGWGDLSFPFSPPQVMLGKLWLFGAWSSVRGWIIVMGWGLNHAAPSTCPSDCLSPSFPWSRSPGQQGQTTQNGTKGLLVPTELCWDAQGFVRLRHNNTSSNLERLYSGGCHNIG